MSSGVELANEAKRSRTSIVLLIASAAAIYYSTQIYLDHGFFWWDLGIAIIGVVFLAAGCYTIYRDWQHEQDYRGSLRRQQDAEAEKSEAEAEEVRNKRIREDQNEKGSATVRREAEEMPEEELPSINIGAEREETEEVSEKVE